MVRRLAALALGIAVSQVAAASAEIHVVELRGMIHPVSSAYIQDAIAEADRADAAALVIEMDTPGGFVSDTKEIVQKILAAKTPVIGFVTPAAARAASGGFLILISCDVAAMSPGTNTGAAHPIGAGGPNVKEDIGLQKEASDLAAFARSIAENRGRNVKSAESGVTEIHSWTEKEALEDKLIEAVASDLETLLEQLHGRVVRRMGGEDHTLDLEGPVVRSRAMTFIERTQDFLLTPMVAAFLLMLGIVGIYIELNHPGLILPGVVGAAALLLFAYAAHILPVSVLGLLLIALSIVLFVLEIKIVSGGLLGLGGVAALVVGSLLLFEGPIPEMRLPLMFVLPTSLAVGVIMLLIVRYVVSAQREHVATGREGMVGEIGTAATDLAPEGKIFIHGEYWNARATGAIPRGTRVRVRAVEEMWLVVEPEGRST